MHRCRGALAAAGNTSGFTLVEVLVAMALLSSAVVTVLHLVVMSSAANLSARDLSYTTALASAKLDELRAGDVAGLVGSSPVAWAFSAPGHVDYLDAAGKVVGSAGLPPADAIYIRRWSVTISPGAVVIQVSAARLRRDAGTGASSDQSAFDVARVVGLGGVLP